MDQSIFYEIWNDFALGAKYAQAKLLLKGGHTLAGTVNYDGGTWAFVRINDTVTYVAVNGIVAIETY